jgi:hypothetical protein
MKLWVDDIVKAPEGYAWCKSVGGAKVFIEVYEKKDENRDPLTMISVDTDAGCWKDQGGDYIELLKWLEATGRNYEVKIHTKDCRDNCKVVEEMQEIIHRNGWDTMNAYLVFNGKKIMLTAKQLNVLGLAESRNNPFDRVAKEKMYYYVDKDGKVDNFCECGDSLDDDLKKASNYFNDEDFAIQVALHQLLYRKLLKFAYDNDCKDTAEWRRYSKHWFIYYNWDMKEVNLGLANVEQHFSTVYFSTAQAAYQAIKEVAEPFMKEHPDFVW